MTIEALLTEYLGVKNEKLLHELRHVITVHTLEKDAHDIFDGDPLEDICFLLSGIVRAYYVDKDGHEITDCLVSDQTDRIISDAPVDGFSHINVQALTPCVVAALPLAEIDRLRMIYPEVSQVYDTILGRSLQKHREHKDVISRYSAKERYAWMQESYPGLAEKVKKKYVAQFLHITPQTLSTLRRDERSKQKKAQEE